MTSQACFAIDFTPQSMFIRNFGHTLGKKFLLSKDENNSCEMLAVGILNDLDVQPLDKLESVLEFHM